MSDNRDNRIGRFLSGEMSAEERVDFEQIMASDPALKDQVEATARIWALAENQAIESWNTDAAWSVFTSNVGHQTVSPARSIRKVLYWAAVAVFVVAAGYFAFFNSPSPQSFAFESVENGAVELEEGSVVFLNQSSDLEVFPFSKTKRELKLSGEAFFEVKSDASRPMTIVCGQTMTKVLGTTFNISEKGDQVTIYVLEGKVIFQSLDDPGSALALTSGEGAVFHDNKVEQVLNPSMNAVAWHSQQLQFKNQPLSDLVEDIKSYFGTEIIVEKESILTCRVSSQKPFNKEEMKSTLKGVAVSIGAELVEENGRLIIRGGKCD